MGWRQINTTEIYIYNTRTELMFSSIVKDSIKWETERKGAPSKLTFTVIKDKTADFNEGNPVLFKYNGKNVFYGFVFSKSRDKEHHINVTAYDQLRYLKNKQTYAYKNKSADELIRMIAKDFKLQIGELESTGYKMDDIQDNATLFDIIQNSLNETILNKNQMFVLYDDFGKLTLKNAANMLIPTDFVISEDTAQNFDYKSSIDEQTYNQIYLYNENSENGQPYIAKDSANIKNWGVLQLTEKFTDNENPQAKSAALLSLYNNVSRSLKINNAFGDICARAGASIFVNLNIGDIILSDYMLIEKATHTFEDNLHTMSLDLRKKSFI